MKLEQIEKLLELKKENPNLEIIFLVNYEVCRSDYFQYWRARVEKIEKGIYFLRGETIFIDEDDLRADIALDVWDDNKTDNENEKILDDIIQNECEYKKEAIIIYFGI